MRAFNFARRSKWISAILLLGTSLNPLAAQLLGPSFLVNTQMPFDCRFPAIAADDDGKFLVVWMIRNIDGSGAGVFGQQFDEQAVRVGGEFLVNNSIFGDQTSPSVAVNGSNFIVAWDSNGDGLIHAQSYDADGVEVAGEILVNSPYVATSENSDVAADSEEGFVVVWQQPSFNPGLSGRRFDSNGNPLGSVFPVLSELGGNVYSPHVAMDSSGGFVVTWSERSSGSGTSAVLARRFDTAGNPQGEEIQVYLEATQDILYTFVASDGQGNFVVVWWRTLPGFGVELLGRRFDASGAPQGDQFRVNSEPFALIGDAAIAMDSIGRFVVVWGGYITAFRQVMAQRFFPGGEPAGGNVLVHTWNNARRDVAVALNDRGNIIVSYIEAAMIRGQRLQNWNWIWNDGFEGGDACPWSLTLGGACP